MIVCAVFGDLFHELVVVLGLEVLSVGGKDELVTRLNLGLLGGLPRQLVLGVQGAGEGSGASFLLLQVKLLVLSSVRVHLHTNPLGLVAVVLEAEGGCARVGECCLSAFYFRLSNSSDLALVVNLSGFLATSVLIISRA